MRIGKIKVMVGKLKNVFLKNGSCKIKNLKLKNKNTNWVFVKIKLGFEEIKIEKL